MKLLPLSTDQSASTCAADLSSRREGLENRPRKPEQTPPRARNGGPRGWHIPGATGHQQSVERAFGAGSVARKANFDAWEPAFWRLACGQAIEEEAGDDLLELHGFSSPSRTSCSSSTPRAILVQNSRVRREMARGVELGRDRSGCGPLKVVARTGSREGGRGACGEVGG